MLTPVSTCDEELPVAQPAATPLGPQAVRLQRENLRLRGALDSLTVLDEIAAAAVSALPADAVIELIIEKSVEGLDAEWGALHLSDERSQQPRCTTLARHGAPSGGSVSAAVAGTVLGWALKEQRPLRANDVAADPRFRIPVEGVESVLSVPLRLKGQTVGLLSLFNKLSPEGFSSEDEQALGVIAAHSAHVLQSERRIGELRESAEKLKQENADLKKRVGRAAGEPTLIGSAAPIRDLLETVERIHNVQFDVLITGESGTGKELLARAIHDRSSRAAGPFVAINCAALPETLLEAELFGVDKGVATGVDRRAGHFENADGGTLFLDEIGDLTLSAQAKILRVLQERRVRRLGGGDEIPVDVRVVAATHAPLEERIKEHRFREDLFYRLNVIRLQTPALRKIPNDIDLLAKHFLRLACRQIGRDSVDLAEETLGVLRAYSWPGNVRQLRNEMQRVAIEARGDRAEPQDLSDEVRAGADEPVVAAGDRFDSKLAAYERRLIAEALAAQGGNQVETAKALGISRSGLLKKMKRLGL